MTAPSLWQVPAKPVQLANRDVHVWRVNLDQPAHMIIHLARSLSYDERQKARRFYFQRDHNHFIVAHGALRYILGSYLGIAPAQICFDNDEQGKPILVPNHKGDALHFNLTHSHKLALIAVSRQWRVGIDLEYMRDDLASLQIAERFFSPREVAVLRALPKKMQRTAFFNCWTRKEAYLKGRGLGLALPLDCFDVSIIPGEPAILVNPGGDSNKARNWSLQELSPCPGYVGALAVSGFAYHLKRWHWDSKVTIPTALRSIY